MAEAIRVHVLQSKATGRPESATYKPLTSSNDDRASFAIGESDLKEVDHDDDDDEDNEADLRTLVGGPDSSKFHSSRDSCSLSMKGDKDTSSGGVSQVEMEGEEDRDVRSYTFMEIMSYSAIRRQMLSLYSLAFVGGSWGAVTLLLFYTPTAAG